MHRLRDRIMLGFRSYSARFVSLLALAACVGQATSQKPAPKEPSPDQDIPRLIDKLRDVAEGHPRDMPTRGTGFLSLGSSWFPMIYLTPASADILRDLVKRGAEAAPHLVAHLDDNRPTKFTIGRLEVRGHTGGRYFNDEYDYNSRTVKEPPAEVNRNLRHDFVSHTLTVGDLCFTVLGEIVNRNFTVLRPQPTGFIVVNSPTHSDALRKAIKNEWGNLTPESHKQSLIRDLLEPDREERRTGACLRLGYYYREALDPLVLRQLAEPTYDEIEVRQFIREKLYRAKDAKERKKLFDAFIAERGEVARQGILVYLFGDTKWTELTDAARVCLVELYGYPKGVEPKDGPHLMPLENGVQARFIDTLLFFPSTTIDQAVRKVLHATANEDLAHACVRYLVGRGADADIRRYVEQRLKGADELRRRQLESMQDLLGWTPLHVAAEVSEAATVERLILQGFPVDVRAANGQSPLHVASRHGNIDSMRILLKRKADPNLTDQQGRTPLLLTAHHEDAVEMLLSAGAKPSDILLATIAGRADLVKGFLAKDKALTEARTPGGATPLHLAAKLGHLEIMEVLLANGADVNARDSLKFTPLHWAGYVQDVSALLLVHKADRNAKAWDGSTPWDFGIER